MAKRYYWLKLQEDFFESDEIKIIESMPNGVVYSNFYLKLLCKSLKTDGRLIFKDIIPYTPDMLANITGVAVDTVRVAIDIFIKLGLMEKLDDGALYMIAVENMTGSESEWATKKRNYRKSLEVKGKNLLLETSKTNKRHNEDNVQNEKDIVLNKEDIVRQEIEKDIEIESYNHDHNILNNIKNIKRDEKNDDLKKIKQWFKENGIDFSKKHEIKVLELLKNNSLDFVLNTFQEQLDILKNKSDVKSVAAVFSTHLFKGTCEVNTQELEKKEVEHQKVKEEERKESEKNDNILSIFFKIPLEKQEEIEMEILKKHNIKHFSELKTKSETMYYRLISSFIYEELKEKGLI